MRFLASARTARAALILLTLATGAVGAQTLAHKGWAGSGLNVEPWWTGAVLYQIDPQSLQRSGNKSGLQRIIQRLDYLRELGTDALVLSPFPLRPDFSKTSNGPPFDSRYGSEEDLNQLVREASRRKIRIIVDLPLSSSHSTQETLNAARFWLSRGNAGLRLTPDVRSSEAALTSFQLTDRLKQLKRLCATYAGQRVLLWDLPGPAPGGGSTSRRGGVTASAVDGPQLVVDGRLALMPKFDPSDLRAALKQPETATTGATPVPVSDTPNGPRSFAHYGDGVHDAQMARIVTAALLAGRGAPLLLSGQETGMATGEDESALTASEALEDMDPDSLLNWYRKLSALRHTNAALHGGTMQLIAESNPDIVAWVRTPDAGGAPVLIVCNLTGGSLLVSVAADVRRIGIETGRGMMHTLASPTVSGPVSMSAIALPPYGIYIGELPRQPGLESAPSPLRPSPSGARTSP